MGNILNSKESNINVLLLGLGGSGKTHLLYNALLEEGWQDKVKKGNSSYAQKDKNPRTQVN
jgi:GTPase SAR1 family protein